MEGNQQFALFCFLPGVSTLSGQSGAHIWWLLRSCPQGLDRAQERLHPLGSPLHRARTSCTEWPRAGQTWRGSGEDRMGRLEGHPQGTGITQQA